MHQGNEKERLGSKGKSKISHFLLSSLIVIEGIGLCAKKKKKKKKAGIAGLVC